MTRTVSVTRHRRANGKESRDESSAFGAVVAYAPAAIPGPGIREVSAGVDAPPCAEGLLWGFQIGRISLFELN